MAAQNQQYLQNGGKLFNFKAPPNQSRGLRDCKPSRLWGDNPFSFGAIRLHVYSTLRLGATGAQTYTIWKRLQTCRV